MSATNPFLGCWDFNILTPRGQRGSWLGVSERDGVLDVWHQPTGGHVVCASDVTMDGAHLSFVSPATNSQPITIWHLDVEGDRVTGRQVRGDDVVQLAGVRAPTLARPAPAAWSEPEPLFNGRDLEGWAPVGPDSQWAVEDGHLVNRARGANLRSVRTFDDFRLHFEVYCPEHGNSGMYLRGRYEVQIEAEPLSKNPPERRMGSIYGRIAPVPELPRRMDAWHVFDITLVGRTVTLAHDGVTVIAAATIDGITGGALDADEGEPGPLYIQGDHTGGLRFRNITIAVPRA